MGDDAAIEQRQEVGNAQVAQAGPALAPPTPFAEPGLAARVLALQRSAGNGAVNQMLRRGAPTLARRELDAPAAAAAPRVAVKQLKFVCWFVGNDLYGTQARRWAKFFLADHIPIQAPTLEAAVKRMSEIGMHHRKGDAAARIDEIVLVAHGNLTGFIKMPLVAGKRGTTTEDLISLQREFHSGGRKPFRDSRKILLSLIDHGTNVIVRGCRAGRVPELVTAMRAFFGGSANVYIPKDLQAFTRMRIGGPTIKDAEAAYDHLVEHGYVPDDPATTPQEKAAWVKKHLPDGHVPEAFFVSDEHEAAFRHPGVQGADDPALQAGKDYAGAEMIGVDRWGVAMGRHDAFDDPTLDELSMDDLLAEAHATLGQLRKLESGDPENWRDAGDLAYQMLRYHRAWGRRSMEDQAAALKAAGANPKDPIAGLYIPGASYDTNLLAIQASRRPDLTHHHTDTFMTEDLLPPAQPTLEGEEQLDAEQADDPELLARLGSGELATKGQAILDAIAAEEAKPAPDAQRIGALASSMLALHQAWAEGPGAAAAMADDSGDPLAGLRIPGLAYDTNELAQKAAKLKRKPRAAPARKRPPAAAPSDPPLSSHDRDPIEWGRLPQIHKPGLSVAAGDMGADKAITVARLARFKYALEWKIDKPVLKYVKLNKAVVTFDGALDWKSGKGDTEITAGMLGSIARTIKTGDTGKVSGGQVEASTFLDDEKKWKGKAGYESGESSTTKGGKTGAGEKWEYSLGVEYMWGDKTSSELKLVLIGNDSSKEKDPVSLLTAKFSPVIFTFKSGELQIPMQDGGFAQFTGKVYLTFEGSPNWEQIAPDVIARLGPRALPAAVTAGEVVVIGGVVIGAVLTLYAWYRSVQEIQDLKALAREADKAVEDFRSGFLTSIGMKGSGGDPSSFAGKEGARHGQVWMQSMLAKYRVWQKDPKAKENYRKRYSEQYKLTHGHHPPASAIPDPPVLTDEEVLDAFRLRWGASEQARTHAYNCVTRAYEGAIRRQLFDAFAAAHPSEVSTAARVGIARARAGLKPYGDLPGDQPDYGHLDNIFAYGSTETGPRDAPQP